MPESETDFKGNEVLTVEQARIGLGELVARVNYGRERIVLTRYGKPAAVLVGIDEAKQYLPVSAE